MKKSNLKKMSIFIIFVILLMSIFIYNIFPIIYGKLYSGNHIGIDISIYYDGIQISLDDVDIKCVNPDNKDEQVEKKDATYSVKGGKYGRYIFTVTIPGTHIKEGEENIFVELQYLNSNDWYISDTDCIINIKSDGDTMKCNCELVTKYNDGTSADYSEEKQIEKGSVKFSWGL